MSTRSMADEARDYIIANGHTPDAIENVKRRATSTRYDAQHDVLCMQFSDGSGCVVTVSGLPRAAREAAARSVDWSDGVFPICRICNVASVLDAATQSVCESCFCRLVEHTWRAMPLVQSLVLQHRIDSGTLPKFAPDPVLQARAERAEEEARRREQEAQARLARAAREKRIAEAQKQRTQARTSQEQLNAASELKHQAKKALLNRMYGGTGSSDEAINAQAEVLKAEAAQRARIESELQTFHKLRAYDLSFKPQIDEIP